MKDLQKSAMTENNLLSFDFYAEIRMKNMAKLLNQDM